MEIRESSHSLLVFEGHRVEEYSLAHPDSQIVECPYPQTGQGQKICPPLPKDSENKMWRQHF